MRRRKAWQVPEADAISLLQHIEEKIRASGIDARDRDVLIRLRSIIEADLAETAGAKPPTIAGPSGTSAPDPAG